MGAIASALQLPVESREATSTADSRRIAALDGVRGVAILLVMILHMTVLPENAAVDQYWSKLCAVGWSGVTLFFVLSGFLITGILLDTKSAPNYFRSFYIRRMLRIFPLYYAILLLALVILPHFDHPKAERFGQVRGAEWWYCVYLGNILMAVRGTKLHGILDVTWSLSIEEQFYIIWPLVVWLLSRRALNRACIALMLGALITRSAMVLADANYFSIYVLTTSHVDALAMGGLLALAVRSPAGIQCWVAPARILIFVGIAVAIIAPAFGISLWRGSSIMTGVGYSLIMLLFAGVIVLALQAPRWTAFFENRILRMFGKYSYAIYLVHVPLRSMMRDAIYPSDHFLTVAGSALPGQILFYALTIALSLGIAWLSWNLFEKHFLQARKWFASGRAAAGLPAVAG